MGSEEQNEKAIDQVFERLGDFRSAIDCIRTGQSELGPSEYDCDAATKTHDEIMDEMNVEPEKEPEVHLRTLRAELQKALSVLREYASDPQSGHVSPTYRFKLTTIIGRIENS